MRSPQRVSAARLCALNAGIQFVWGAVLAVSLQARAIALGGRSAIAAYATVAALGALVATVVQLASGVWSDRLRARGASRVPFYATGVALALPALAWFYLAPDYPQLVAAFLTLQLAMNVCSGPYQAVIPDYVTPDRRGRASAWMSGYQSIGNALGLVVGGFVRDGRAVAGALGAGLLATFAVTVFAVRAAPRATVVPQARHSLGTGARLGGSLGTLLISRGLVNVGFFTVLGFLLFFVRDALGVRGAALETQTALVFLTFTLAAVGGAVASAGATDRYDRRAVVSIAVGIIAVALVLLATAHTLPVAYLAAAVAGAAWGAFVTADWALATALLPPGTMATAMGVWNVATTIPQTIAPLVAGALVARVNLSHPGAGVRAAIVLALAEFLAGGAIVWRLPRGARIEQSDDAASDRIGSTRLT